MLEGDFDVHIDSNGVHISRKDPGDSGPMGKPTKILLLAVLLVVVFLILHAVHFSRESARRQNLIVQVNRAFNEGRQLLLDHQFRAAILRFDDVIRLAPRHADAMVLRGNAYRELRQYDRAMQD